MFSLLLKELIFIFYLYLYYKSKKNRSIDIFPLGFKDFELETLNLHVRDFPSLFPITIVQHEDNYLIIVWFH